jgi:antirestriction protein ArdC
MTKKTDTTKTDVYSRVTTRIIESLEQGVRPWMKPWSAGYTDGRITRPLRHNGTPYQGINVLLLWGDAIDKGFKSSTWMTYKQAQELCAQVRKGEMGSLVVYANSYTKLETTEQGEEAEREIPFLKGYTVFNVEQIEGLPAQYVQAPCPAPQPVELNETAETFFRNTGATFRHGGNRAFYVPSADFIQLPPPEAFKDATSYTATKAHELVHWTGNAKRCAREFGKRFGDKAYAFEELVAELGAAFLCADLNLTPEVREDHAAYLATWLKVLKEDKRAIFSAASHAQRAANFLSEFEKTMEQEVA